MFATYEGAKGACKPGVWTQVMSHTKNASTRRKSFVEEQLTSAYLTGEVDKVIASIKKEKKYYIEQGFTNIKIEEQGYGEDKYIYYYGLRPESDEEFRARIVALDVKEKEQKDRDLKELEYLQKKLGVKP